MIMNTDTKPKRKRNKPLEPDNVNIFFNRQQLFQNLEEQYLRLENLACNREREEPRTVRMAAVKGTASISVVPILPE